MREKFSQLASRINCRSKQISKKRAKKNPRRVWPKRKASVRVKGGVRVRKKRIIFRGKAKLKREMVREKY